MGRCPLKPSHFSHLRHQVFPFFEIPNSGVRFIVIALAVGFPIAMLLSWLYELTSPRATFPARVAVDALLTL